MKRLAALSAIAFAATVLPSQANATIVMCGATGVGTPGALSTPCPQGANVLFNSGDQVGTTVYGLTQQGTQVVYQGTTNAPTNSTTIRADGGQAKITGTLNLQTQAANDTYLLKTLNFHLAGDLTFNNVELALQGGTATSVSFVVTDNAGDVFNFDNLVIPNGNAFYNFVGINGETIRNVVIDFNGETGIVDASQFRLDQVAPTEPPTQNAVPEPATWAMMLFGFGAVGAGMRRRRKEGGARVRFNFA